MHDYRFGVGIFMMFELKQKNMWFFWLLVWPDWEAVKCFCGFFWLMHPPRRIGLLLLVIDFLVQLSLLQRYGLVV